MRQLRILVSASPGGTLGRYFCGVVAALADRGHLVIHVVPPGWTERLDPPVGVTLTSWPESSASSVASFRYVDELIASQRPDLVVASFAGDLTCLAASCLRQVPARAVFHHTTLAQTEMDAPPRRNWLARAQLERRRLLYRSATTVLCATDHVAQDLQGNFHVPASRLRVETFAIPDPKVSAQQRVPHRVVCVGRVDRSKGQDVLVACLPHLIKRNRDIEIRFVGEGRLLPEVQSQAERLGVSSHCRFLGQFGRNQVFEELASAQVAAFPSRDEGFGLVAVEAEACGTPIVASDIPAFRLTVGHDRAGILVPPDDPESLAKALGRLLTDGEERSRLAVGARARFLQRWDLATRSPELAAFYEQLARPTTRR